MNLRRFSMHPGSRHRSAIRGPDDLGRARSYFLAGLFAAIWLGGFPFAIGATTSHSIVDLAERSDLPAVQRALKTGADPNAAQPDGMTPLLWAAFLDRFDLAKVLVDASGRVSATNRFGVAPISLAARNGNAAMMELFLKHGADPNFSLPGGETVLMTAARLGKPDPIRLLLGAGAQVHVLERRQQSALMWAAAEGHVAAVELLLAAGSDFRHLLPDSDFTALHFAAREGRTEVIRRLVAAGADIHSTLQPRKAGGKGPRKGTSALHLAVENGHFETALELVRLGADPNDQRCGFTPLHILTWVRKPNRGDGDDGDPPPIGSGSMTSLQFARRLVELGATVNARLTHGNSGRGILTRKGATPFLLASATADLAYLKLLKELGADPAIPNENENTPFLAASGVGTLAPTEEAGTEPEVLECLEFLLATGADPNTRDRNGETAMHGAAYKSLPEVVRFLDGHGAKIDVWNRTNKWGWTPWRIAEGHRVGNFKPSFETMAVLKEVMTRRGSPPPTDPLSRKDDAWSPPPQ